MFYSVKVSLYLSVKNNGPPFLIHLQYLEKFHMKSSSFESLKIIQCPFQFFLLWSTKIDYRILKFHQLGIEVKEIIAEIQLSF